MTNEQILSQIEYLIGRSLLDTTGYWQEINESLESLIRQISISQKEDETFNAKIISVFAALVPRVFHSF